MEALKLAVEAYQRLLTASPVDVRRRELPPMYFLFICTIIAMFLVFVPGAQTGGRVPPAIVEPILNKLELGYLSGSAAFFDIVIIALAAIALTKLIRGFSSSAGSTSRQDPLEDALSPVREALVGSWKLKFETFRSSAGLHELECQVDVGITEAKKLSFDIVKSSQLNLRETALDISLVVISVSEVHLSVIFEERVNFDNIKGLFSYLVRLKDISDADERKIVFKGDWYALDELGRGFERSGHCRFEKQ